MVNPVVAERIVVHVTVVVVPVEFWCWRKLGSGIASAAGIICCTRTVVVRTVNFAVVVRLVVRTVVVWLVIRTIGNVAVVWTVSLVVRAVGYVAIVWLVVRAVGYIAVVRPVVRTRSHVANIAVVSSSVDTGVRVASRLG